MSDDERSFSRILCSRPTEISALTDAMATWESALGIDAKTIRYVGLICDELIANIAAYAYRGRDDGAIEVDASFDGHTVRVMLRDYGPPFDPTTAELPDNTRSSVDERRLGGLGVHFVRRIADSLHYRRQGDANELVFFKSLSRA